MFSIRKNIILHYTHTHTHTHTHTYIYIYIYIYTRVCVLVCMYISFKHVDEHLNMFMRARTHTHISGKQIGICIFEIICLYLYA